MRLELRHLRYFLAVAHERHFGRAARRLGMAQPPLSQQIAALERLLEVRLFDRSSRQVRLTAAGTALLEEASRVIMLTERIPAVVAAAASGQSGVLSVGISASAALGLIPPVFRQFRRDYPALQLKLRDAVPEENLFAVETGVLDVVLARGPIVSSRLEVETIRREAIVLTVASDHPLAANASVEWSRLAEHEFVMFPRAAAPALHDAIIARCVAAGFSPNIVHEASEWSTVSTLVAAGAGLGFAPESAGRIHVEGIAFVRLEGETAYAEVAAAWRRDNTSFALQAFIAIARGAV